MKNIKPRTRMHAEACIYITTTKNEPDTKKLLKQKWCQLS